eukprot:gnl/Hemi2/26244_TR8812_c0_g1_i1.p1 gnl/Hemi2/26244_TR8812_c0_g1~~gnl/Hemi2/26244_TR8812_c0_g1_i1.p1  ORF type:complete len:640 (+),score=173.19 gnl/Hemi2/26244_TR8812_c0_g1_i1:69-1988(+)
MSAFAGVAAGVAGPGADVEDAFVLTEVSIDSDSDDDYRYENVELESLGDDDVDDTGLEAIIRNLKPKEANPSVEFQVQPVQPSISRRPEVIDDFIRNYLNKLGLTKTLELFQTEWYELKECGKISNEDVVVVPDIYKRNQELDDTVKSLREELAHSKIVAETAKSTWDQLKKERDLHRMHHKRVVQEKNKLISDLKRLKMHYAGYEPTIQELQQKQQSHLRGKTMLRLENEKLQVKVAALEETLQQGEQAVASGLSRQAQSKDGGRLGTGNAKTPTPTPAPLPEAPQAKSSSDVHTAGSARAKLQASAAGSRRHRSPARARDTPYPSETTPPSYNNLSDTMPNVQQFGLTQTYRAHPSAISAIALHPTKSFLATSSDDNTWKLWSLPAGELAMTGAGHRHFVSGCAFHPRGGHLATSSADHTVKLWDLLNSTVSNTFADHTNHVWGVALHEGGDFMASCSMDQTARLWDLNSGRCRHAFRGHTGPVMSVAFQPYMPVIATASGDGSARLWDVRSGNNTTTIKQSSSVNKCSFNNRGDSVVTCAADGRIQIWDLRHGASLKLSLPNDDGTAPRNAVFDRSGFLVAVGMANGHIKVYKLQDTPTVVKTLEGHLGPVNDLVFDREARSIVSGGEDGSFRLWS